MARWLVYDPGQSPFHVRGTTYLGICEYAKTHVQGGMARVAEALPAGAHRAFAVQAFERGSLYDALPIRPITEVIAKLEGKTWEETVRARAELTARGDLNVFRRVLFRALRPEKVVEKMKQAALEQFDFGEIEVLELAAGRSRAVFHGVPQPLGPWFLAVLQGYGSTLIAASGGKQPQVTGRMIPKGSREGVQLVDVSFQVAWS